MPPDSSPPPPSPDAAPKAAWWRRVLPFVTAAALVAVAFGRLDLAAFAARLAAVNVPLFAGFAALFVLALLTADAFATAVIYRRTVAPVRFVDFWILRGASYLPSLVNHHLGQVFVTYYLSRIYGISLARMAGGTLLVYASWMGALLGTGCLALVVDGQPLLFPALAFGAGLAYLAVIALRPAFLARTKLLAPLFEAGLAGHVVAVLVRLPHLAVLFLGTWVPFLLFGVDVPFSAALVYVPILMVASTLPITFQGLGTRDLVAAACFARFASGATPEIQRAAVAAATTSFVVAFSIAEALMGLLLLRRALPSRVSAGATGPGSPT